MKMKNINLVHQHIEKLILGAAVLIAAIIILLYAVGSPYTAKIGGRAMGARDVEDYVRQQAQTLRSAMENTQPQFTPPAIARYSQELAGRLDTPASPVATYGTPLAQIGLAAAHGGGQQLLDPYDLPRPPVPRDPKVGTGFAVLGAVEDAGQNSRLIQLVGERDPLDIRYVSISADWPVREWRERLEKSSLPTSFWRAMIGLTAVYLQRQELDPATGEWGNTTIVQPLPTQYAAMPGEKGVFNDATALELVSFLRLQQASVARSDFPPLAKGVWLPPGSDPMNLTKEEQERVKKLRTELTRLEKQIDTHRKTQERAMERQRLEDERNRRGAARRVPDGMAGRTPTRTPAPRATPPAPTGGRDVTAELQRLQVEWQEKRRQLDEIIGVAPDALTGTGMMDPYGMMPMDPGGYGPYDMPPGGYDPYPGQYGQPPVYGPGMPGRRGAPAPPTAPTPPVDESITVWAHDLTVQPGKTYRYRVLVSVFNPLFRQTRVEANQRREFFDQVGLGPDEDELAASPWSEPVKIDPEYMFFFLSGTAGQVAEIEVWHMYSGQLHMSRFRESPGDPIGGEATVTIDNVQRKLPMHTGAVMVDLVSSGGTALGSDARLLYFDPATNAIAMRSSQQDESSEDRTRLQNLHALQQQNMLGPSAMR